MATAACFDTRDDRAVCSSGELQSATISENEEMLPGYACVDCHASTNAAAGESEAPIFAFAGTVYPTVHEPDGCISPTAMGAEVVVVSASGRRYTAKVNRVGNFKFEADDIEYPLTASVRWQGRVHWMVAPTMTGDCNSCHSSSGTEGAKGRIRLP